MNSTYLAVGIIVAALAFVVMARRKGASPVATLAAPLKAVDPRTAGEQLVEQAKVIGQAKAGVVVQEVLGTAEAKRFVKDLIESLSEAHPDVTRPASPPGPNPTFPPTPSGN